MYVNGALQNTTALGTFVDKNSTDLLFGAKDSNDMEGAFLNGLVDEVELFDRALAASEISAIYNAGHSGKCKVEVSLKPGELTFAAQAVGTTSPPQAVTLKNVSPTGSAGYREHFHDRGFRRKQSVPRILESRPKSALSRLHLLLCRRERLRGRWR